MSPERLRQVEELYHLARERPLEERADMLAQADPELRREVESLLAQNGEDLLDRPAMEVAVKLLEDSSAERLALGAQLGPYKIESSIGAGGMGQVYKARDTRLGRAVAIKVSSKQFNARFEREARAISALNHPHICTLYDVGPDYLVMELVEGATLAARLKKGQLPLDQVLRYGVEIAGALDQAHRSGVIHRDLKPCNIMITKLGVKVLDFGLAKTTGESVTASNVVMGTPGYMAPEQLEGKACDARTDIYALGLLLREMTTGKGSESLEALPPQFAHVVERCLVKEPEGRWQAASDIKEELHWIATALVPGKIETRKSRWQLGTGVAIAGLLVAGALTLWWNRSNTPEAPTLRYLTYSGHDRSPAASPDGRTIAFSSDRDGRSRIWLKDLGRGDEVALTAGPDDDVPRFSPDGTMILFARGQFPHRSLFRVGAVGGEPRKLLEDVQGGDWSPDGRLIAYIRDKSTEDRDASAIGLVSADGTGVREIALDNGFVLRQPRWSPDGQTIAARQRGHSSGTPDSVFLVGSDGKRPRRLSAFPGGFAITSLAWSNLNDVVYSQMESPARGVGTARIVQQNVTSGAAHSVLRSPHVSTFLEVLGPGLMVFDTTLSRQSLREISLRGAAASPESRSLTRGNSQDRQPSYSPDGEWVIFSSDRSGNLDLWELSIKSGAVRRITDDPADDWDPAFTPDGKRITWSSNRTGHFEIWIANADGSGARQLTKYGTDAENPVATRDGWILYCYANPAGEFAVGKIRQDGSEASRLAGGDFVEVSPDDRYAAQGFGNGIRFFRITDGSVVPFQIDAANRFRWMPDGRAIAFTDPNQTGVFVQDFVLGQDTHNTRRLLGDFGPELRTETFAISPDGSSMTVALVERTSSLMIADRVPGVSRPRRRVP